MTMFCPDCMQNLDEVPPGDPCPKCGGDRRSAQVFARAALAAAAVMDVRVKIGYNLAPGWTYQWENIQRHLVRLREQYGGLKVSNVEVEQTVHSLFLALTHLGDWLHQDSALSSKLSKTTVGNFYQSHPNSLRVCRAYANTFKHMKRDSPNALIARITSIEDGPTGYSVTIGYGAVDLLAKPPTEVDALVLAEQCEQDWRGLLTQLGIPIPP